MTELRLVLLIAGAIALALLWYLDARRARLLRRQRTVLRRAADTGPVSRAMDPCSGEESGAAAVLPPMSPRPDANQAQPAAPDFAAVLVLAGGGAPIEQRRLFEVAETAGLDFAEQGVFIMPGSDTAPLFSVANLREPGTFTRAEDAPALRGVVLIMRLPVAADSAMAAELMLHTADLLAAGLGGTVCDANRSPMDQAGREALRRKVSNPGL